VHQPLHKERVAPTVRRLADFAKSLTMRRSLMYSVASANKKKRQNKEMGKV